MDNIKDENLRRLGKYIAQELIDSARQTSREDWIEENMPDPDADGYESVNLSVTVEIVTGEVIDAIYQIYPVEKFAAPQWVKDYRRKADHFAKMIIDTITGTKINAVQAAVAEFQTSPDIDSELFDARGNALPPGQSPPAAAEGLSLIHI